MSFSARIFHGMARGDAECGQELYEFIRKKAITFLSRGAYGDLNDIVHDVWLEVWDDLRNGVVRAENAVTSYACTILRRKISTHTAKTIESRQIRALDVVHGDHRVRTLVEVCHDWSALSSGANLPGYEMERREEQAAAKAKLNEMMSALTPIQREILCRLFENQLDGQIREEMGLTVNQLRNDLHRTKVKLVAIAAPRVKPTRTLRTMATAA